jgi:hypothetical protein
MKRLAEGDPESKDDQDDGDADTPARQLVAPAATTPLVALDRREGRHGA